MDVVWLQKDSQISKSREIAVVEKQDNEESVRFILKDHQGNWTVIVDADGEVEQELSYDAWGNMRDPETWCVDASIAPMFDRGYTGHEHLYGFGLINMNGRMYDPVMSSFLSVDRYVQEPENSQGFNRYAYCMYNPLKYVDPSGWMMSRPSGSGGIPPQFKAKQPVAVDGGYQLVCIDGMLYGGRLNEVEVIDTAISSSGVDSSAKEECKTLVRENIGGGLSAEYSGGEVNAPNISGGGGGGGCASAGMTINNKSTSINIGIQSFELGNGLKTQIIDASVRYNYKTGRTWHQWEFKLTVRQKNWRVVNTLGKEGAGYLKFSKGLGIVGFAASASITTWQVGSYYANGGDDLNVLAKGGLDIIMSAVAFCGPIGFGISMAYFITDLATGGFGGWGEIKAPNNVPENYPNHYKENKP